MINYYILIISFLLIEAETSKISDEYCIDNHLQRYSLNSFQVCSSNDLSNNSIHVWFTMNQTLNDSFNFYRFILRSIDHLLPSNGLIKLLTNFTELTDYKNSLHIFNLNSGEYEVCIEFHSNETKFLYQPRDGCIPIKIGSSSHGSTKQNPTPILIALAIGNVLFFILGLIVQWAQEKRRKRALKNLTKPRIRSQSILTTKTLKEQRDRLVRNLFRRHIEKPRTSRMRQWARNIAFRHRVSTHENEFERPRRFRKWSRQIFTSQTRSRSETMSRDRTPSLGSILTTNNIYTISEDEQQPYISSKKPTFHLSSSEANI